MMAAYTVVSDQTAGFAVEIERPGNAIETVKSSLALGAASAF
jgi:hypothetical protein